MRGGWRVWRRRLWPWIDLGQQSQQSRLFGRVDLHDLKFVRCAFGHFDAFEGKVGVAGQAFGHSEKGRSPNAKRCDTPENCSYASVLSHLVGCRSLVASIKSIADDPFDSYQIGGKKAAILTKMAGKPRAALAKSPQDNYFIYY
jgi:hypothetical protein